MNCAAMPENLIEAELFGHEAGSFTGAVKTRYGRFEEADSGTLFLDELGSLSMPAQDRLLRAVMAKSRASAPPSRFRSTSASSPVTNENLPSRVDQGKFRADLLDRLSFEVTPCPCGRATATCRCSPSISAVACRPVSIGPTGLGFTPGRWPSSRLSSLARQRARAAQRRRTRRVSP